MTLMSDDKVIIGSSKTDDQVIIIQKAKNEKDKLWVDKDIVKVGLEFYVKWWGYSLDHFFAQSGKEFPITFL
jgi:hypothetical protein